MIFIPHYHWPELYQIFSMTPVVIWYEYTSVYKRKVDRLYSLVWRRQYALLEKRDRSARSRPLHLLVHCSTMDSLENKARRPASTFPWIFSRRFIFKFHVMFSIPGGRFTYSERDCYNFRLVTFSVDVRCLVD